MPVAMMLTWLTDIDRRLWELENLHYNFTTTRRWAEDAFPAVFFLSFLYVIGALMAAQYMRERKSVDMRKSLVLWNVGLAWFSLIFLYRYIPPLIKDARQGGWMEIVCGLKHYQGEAALWTYLFAVSKLFELGDTVFVVLKKKPLILLHWYHHATVLLYSWFTFVHPVGPGRLFALINAAVHTGMYVYYAVAAARLLRIPPFVNVLLTLLQISQFFAGVFINVFAYRQLVSGRACAITNENFLWSLAMYVSYLVLFCNYFHRTYIAKR